MANIDNRKKIEKDLIPLISQLKEYCKNNKIPMFLSIVSTDNGSETNYFSEIISPTSLNVNISDDKITSMINVINGFRTIPPHKTLEVEDDMLFLGGE